MTKLQTVFNECSSSQLLQPCWGFFIQKCRRNYNNFWEIQISWFSSYLEDADNFFGKEGSWIGCLGHAHSSVVGQDYNTVDLRHLRLDQLFKS